MHTGKMQKTMRFLLLLLALTSCQPKSRPKDTIDSCNNGSEGPCSDDDLNKFKCGICKSIYRCALYGTDSLEWGAAGDRPCECVTEEGNLDTAREECQLQLEPG